MVGDIVVSFGVDLCCEPAAVLSHVVIMELEAPIVKVRLWDTRKISGLIPLEL